VTRINEYKYLNLLSDVLYTGTEEIDRTGTGTLSVFGTQTHYALQDGFPLLTTKKMFWKGILCELLWFISGSTNIKWLQDNKVHIWDSWADENGDLGPVYGQQWRNWGGTLDQLKLVIAGLTNNPQNRRHIVTAWNPTDIPDMALPPCHMMFQFKVRDNKYLDLQLYQRSGDLFLGVPFNIASYMTLLILVSTVTGYHPGTFVHTIGDAHIYLNHIQQVERQLNRVPYPAPTLEINSKEEIDDFVLSDFKLKDYIHHSPLKAPVAV